MKLVKASSLKEEGTSHNPEVKKQVILKKGDLPHQMMLGTAVLQPGQEVSPHSHESMHEVFVLQEGQLEFTVNQNRYLLEAGDCITIGPLETHSIKNKTTQKAKMLYYGLAENTN